MIALGPKKKTGFTIVELLIVIVVIAILAGIAIVAYNGITIRSTIAVLQGDLRTAATRLEADNATTGLFPSSLSLANGGIGIPESSVGYYEYTYTSGDNSFCLTGSNANPSVGSFYISSETKTVQAGTCPTHLGIGGPQIIEPWSMIAAGSYVTCGIYEGSAYCWGTGGSGQIGDGFNSNRNVPTAVSTAGVLAGKTIDKIEIPSSTACVIAEGQVFCWGYNFNGELGNADNTNSNIPVAVDTSGVLGSKTVTELSVGSGIVCVVADAAPYCWGNNDHGKLGNNSLVASNVPVAVDMTGVLAGKTIIDVAAGSESACALTSDNIMACWGWNISGQLGNGGAVSESTVPYAVTMSGLSGATITNIEMSGRNACAITSDGNIACWGGNCSSINGTPTCYGTTASNSNVPVLLNIGATALSGKTISSIGLGGNHSCLVASSEFYCWGYGNYGRLGVGDTVTYNTPTAVYTADALNGLTANFIDGGQNHSCAIADGEVYCWGRNSYGELGGGNTTWTNYPTAIVNPT